MEALQALIDQLNTNYLGANNPSVENTALLRKTDDVAKALGQKVWLGVDDRWYFLAAVQFPNGRLP